jgi:hypothetical protein
MEHTGGDLLAYNVYKLHIGRFKGAAVNGFYLIAFIH